MELWVANVGEGLVVLLGMDFMLRAGVQVCIREGLVQLPGEESILMYDDTVKSRHQKTCISYPENTPSCVPSMGIRIQNEKASRLDEVTGQILVGGDQGCERSVWIDMKTPLAMILQYGSFPQAERFVRPGTRSYPE
ncbi:hypothetical protein PHMEG_00015746 [Phytophthora megakarya]|uniref:Uncharacterized protein n=1 Tax=Phytophthora megakarya TaxID=4795 RepID=A0A225W0X7_9STRA|nr:hypothetical protein PHMEG_00015746 [Phytophthora megakarya]